MQKMDKTLAKKKNCKQKKLVCVSSHLRTAHCTFTDESKLSVYVAFFRGPGECPADLTSASCLLLLRLAFLPRRPSPAELAPEAGSHGRHQTEAATFSVDVTFPRVCRVCREYSCSNCSDKVSNAKKITNKHLTAAHGGGVFFSYLDGRRGTERSGRLAFDSESFWRDTSNATYACNSSRRGRIDVSAARLARFVCTYPLSSSLSLMKCLKVFCVCPFGDRSARKEGGNYIKSNA